MIFVQLAPFDVKLLEASQAFCDALLAAVGTEKFVPTAVAVDAAMNMAKEFVSASMYLGPSMDKDFAVAMEQAAIVKGWVGTLSGELVAFSTVRALLDRLMIVDVMKAFKFA